MEERSRRIVETAVELAEQGGFDAVRLRDVAAHAGVALGTLYRRFRSKEDLLLAALQQQVSDLSTRVERRPPAGDGALERVTAFFQLVTRALCGRPNLARALIRAVATGEAELTQKVGAFHSQIGELVVASLRGDPAGSVPPTDRERAIADVLQHVWFSSLIGWTAGLHGQSFVVDQTRAAARLLLDRSGEDFSPR